MLQDNSHTSEYPKGSRDDLTEAMGDGYRVNYSIAAFYRCNSPRHLFCERLVKRVVGISLGYGVSILLITIIFVGFDPENLATGAAGAAENINGIALGSILGASMVAIALAFGISAPFAKLVRDRLEVSASDSRSRDFPSLYISIDGSLPRFDGIVLIEAFGVVIFYLVRSNRKGSGYINAVKPAGELKELMEEERPEGENPSLCLFCL